MRLMASRAQPLWIMPVFIEVAGVPVGPAQELNVSWRMPGGPVFMVIARAIFLACPAIFCPSLPARL